MDPRKKTWELCQTDLADAARYARGVKDPWYRCQSVATVAWHTSQKKDFIKLKDLALRAAQELPTPNRKVSCAAWIVSATVKRHDIDVSPVVEEMLKAIALEDNPVQRADALLLLFEAVYPKPPLREKVLSALLNACNVMRSWKQPRLLSDITLIVAGDDREKAKILLESISDPSVKRKTERAINESCWLGPHDFFPYYSKSTEAHPVR